MKRINRKTQPFGSIYSNELMISTFESMFSSLNCEELVSCETMENDSETEMKVVIPCQDEPIHSASDVDFVQSL